MKIHVTVGVVTDEFERLEAKCEERVVDRVQGHSRFNDTLISNQVILRCGVGLIRRRRIAVDENDFKVGIGGVELNADVQPVAEKHPERVLCNGVRKSIVFE